MKKEKQNKKRNIIVFKYFDIHTEKPKQFLKEFEQLCEKFSRKDQFNFRFEIEN